MKYEPAPGAIRPMRTTPPYHVFATAQGRETEHHQILIGEVQSMFKDYPDEGVRCLAVWLSFLDFRHAMLKEALQMVDTLIAKGEIKDARDVIRKRLEEDANCDTRAALVAVEALGSL